MNSIQVLEKAIELQKSKGSDYQFPGSSVKQADYYPRGIDTLLDIILAKYLRLRSLADKSKAGCVDVNHESMQDSCVDLINYTSFTAAWLDGKIPGQDSNKDLFGNLMPPPPPPPKPTNKRFICD